MNSPSEVLHHVYGVASLNRIAEAHGLSGDPLEAIVGYLDDAKARKDIVDGLDEEVRGLYAFMDQIGRRLRGERLKKRWFLHGYDDFEARIKPLVDGGLVVVGNTAAREAVSLETALEQGILQQWLQVTPGFEGLAGDPPKAREVVEQVADETSVELERRLLVVEFNLLNLVRALADDTIRLNRDGSPHRSDLKAVAPVVVDRPGSSGRGDATPDPLHVQGWDLIVFLLSIGEALGMIERDGEVLVACRRDPDYFIKPLPERLPLLSRALEHQRAWSELDAAEWFGTGEPPATGQGDGGFLEEGGHGAGLAGPRSSVFAAIRRLNPQDWFDVAGTVATISDLEKTYLKSSLPIPAGDEQSPPTFVEAVITQTLAHVGGVQLGRGADGKARARLTEVGRALLGMGEPPEEPTGKGAILVEPNFEVTTFLDMASLRLLWDLSRFAELVRTSERVVRYKLQGESAQWGYARGYTADGILTILSDFSAQPVPPSVRFALQDWERLHRRVTVYMGGDLVAAAGKADPEVIQSGVQFAIEDKSDVEIIDYLHTYVLAGHAEPLDRALRAQKPQVIDYKGEVVPTLVWVDEERLRAAPGTADLRTMARLQRASVEEEGDTWRLAPDKIRSAFEDDGYLDLIDLLRKGLVGGLSPEREIALKGLLGRPADAQIEQMAVLLVSSEDDGDRVSRIESVAEFVEERLGPCAFQVKKGKVKPLAEVLRGLGIAVET